MIGDIEILSEVPPLADREYIHSLSQGRMALTFATPGGMLPIGDDGEECIYLLELVIRQIKRASITRIEVPLGEPNQ